MRDQNLGRIDLPGVRAGVERRFTIWTGRVRVHAGGKKLLDDGGAAAFAGERDRGDAVRFVALTSAPARINRSTNAVSLLRTAQ